MTQPIPEGYSTVTPTIIVEGAKQAMELYKKAFGATEDYCMMNPDGSKVMHACMNIGTSKVFICDYTPQCGSKTSASFYLYVKDVDAAFAKAKQAGLNAEMEPQDMFWGDRWGTLKDSFGLTWSIATHVRDVSDDELKKAVAAMADPKAA